MRTTLPIEASKTDRLLLRNHKWFRNLVVFQILVNTLESLNMKFPQSTANIAEIKKKYHAAALEEKND